MKLVHNITITTFVKEFEDKELSKNTMEKFLPENHEKEKVRIEEEIVSIDETQKMSILKLKTQKERHNKQIIEKIKELLGPEQTATIANDKRRIDDEGNLFIRLDKKTLEEENKGKLTDSGKCYHIKILLASFPKTREKSEETAKKIFEK